MFEKLLLPTDFSADSERVLECVREIPGARDVVLLHVIDASRPSLTGGDPEQEKERSEKLLLERKHELEKNGIIRAEIAIEIITNPLMQGDIPLTILERAETEDVSLIMMGARGKNTIENILLGSVSANVIRRAKVPVLLMRFPPAKEPKDRHRSLFSRVLVPVDFSRPSDNALLLLRRFPVAGQVILLHVVDRGESEAEVRARVDEARTKLEAIKAGLVAAGISVEVQVQVGYPPEEVHAAAERDNISLILMSPQGEGWTREIRALFVGSTTNAVIRRVTRPVLIAAGTLPG
ncbi:MAG: universal stress protein [Methanomicrobiales archaeon]|nr:universal stress protein [Methanomicrobiales archaeon]